MTTVNIMHWCSPADVMDRGGAMWALTGRCRFGRPTGGGGIEGSNPHEPVLVGIVVIRAAGKVSAVRWNVATNIRNCMDHYLAGCGARVNLSTPSAMNPACHLHTTGFDLPNRRIISAVPQPSAVARMMLARQTCFCGALRSNTIASSRWRSARVTFTTIPALMSRA